MAKNEPTSSEASDDSSPERPLDDLLSKRSKPFRDWKEEREYLRLKWGPQGARIDPLKKKQDLDSPAKEE